MKKIIVTEELLETLLKHQSFLQRSDIRIMSAASNRIALYMHEAEKADLIIANLDSEVLGAEELCATIRREPDMQKVSIIVSSLGRESDMERIKKCRANAFITSPVNPVIMLGNIKRLLEVPTRMDYRVPVSVKVEGEHGTEPFLGHSENISASGMLIGTDNPLSENGIVQCSFFLPNSARIHTEAQVVRQLKRLSEFDPFRYGIRYSSLDEKLRAAIEDFVRDQMGKEEK